MTREDLYHFMASHDLAVLGTISPEGKPECALVGIAITSELEVVFDTLNSSRKYRNLMRDPNAALLVGWANEITVQYEGEARELAEAELAKYQEVYFAKWPECRAHLQWPGITYFVVRPNWIRYSDFNEGSRGIVEMRF